MALDRKRVLFGVCLCLLVLGMLRRKKRGSGRQRKGKGAKGAPKPNFKDLWKLLRPKKPFAPGESGAGSWEMAAMALLCVLRMFLMQHTSELVRLLDTNAMTRNQQEFWRLMRTQLKLSTIVVLHRQTYKYVEQRLGMIWRRKLTQVPFPNSRKVVLLSGKFEE